MSYLLLKMVIVFWCNLEFKKFGILIIMFLGKVNKKNLVDVV